MVIEIVNKDSSIRYQSNDEKVEKEVNEFLKRLLNFNDSDKLKRSLNLNDLHNSVNGSDIVGTTKKCDLEESKDDTDKNIDCDVSFVRKEKTNLADLLTGIEDGSIEMHIGDSFSCALQDGRKVTFVITDEEENALRCEMEELLEFVPRNEIGDWYHTLLYSLFPEELRRAIIKTNRIYKENGNGNLRGFATLLFMPSASEVFSNDEWESWMGDKNVYEQMEYYKDPANRIRCTVDCGRPNDWWLFSTCSGKFTIFVSVDSLGNAVNYSEHTTWASAPVCFRIRKGHKND